MKYNINYTTRARRDLDEIWDYFLSEFQNPAAAQQIVSRIMDDVDQLADFPELGPALSSLVDVKRDYRFLVTGNYLTFYRISSDTIYVDRVLYGRRDYLSCLFGEVPEPDGT